VGLSGLEIPEILRAVNTPIKGKLIYLASDRSTTNVPLYPVTIFYQAWVALRKFLRKFIDFAVKICQQRNFPGAALTFPVRKNFDNQQQNQRRRSAWVGQTDLKSS